MYGCIFVKKRKTMKIKDFKMKCADIQQRDEVIRILEKNGIYDFGSNDWIAISVLAGSYQILNKIGFAVYYPFNELTYSEFMQLYSGSKQDESVESVDFDYTDTYRNLEKITDDNETALKKSDPLDILLEWIDILNNPHFNTIAKDILRSKINELKNNI